MVYKEISPSMKQQLQLRELERERDALREQVSALAHYNYAREPEFVRDHMKLREITQDVQRRLRHLNSKHLKPVMSKCAGIEERLDKLAHSWEEKSELMAEAFLGEQEEGGDGGGAGGGGATRTEPEVKKFINDYVDVRKQAHKKRILKERMAKEQISLKNLISGFLTKWDERAKEGLHHANGDDDDDDRDLSSSPSSSLEFNDMKKGTPERRRRQRVPQTQAKWYPVILRTSESPRIRWSEIT